MWLFANILTLSSCLLYDYLGKRCIDSKKDEAICTTSLTYGILCFLIAVIIYALGLGESGQAPWMLIDETPAAVYSCLCTLFFDVINLFAFYFIGITVENVIFSFGSVFMVLGLVLINLFSGKLEGIQEILRPLPLICLFLIIAGTVLLPHVDEIGTGKKHRSPGQSQKGQPERKDMIAGILLIILSSAFDAGDSLISSVALSEESGNSIDYIIVYFFLSAIYNCVFSAIFMGIKRRWLWVFQRKYLYAWRYALSGVALTLLTYWAITVDAVRADLAWVIYPALAMIAGKVLLKEKFSRREYACMIGIILCSTVFYL